MNTNSNQGLCNHALKDEYSHLVSAFRSAFHAMPNPPPPPPSPHPVNPVLAPVRRVFGPAPRPPRSCNSFRFLSVETISSASLPPPPLPAPRLPPAPRSQWRKKGWATWSSPSQSRSASMRWHAFRAAADSGIPCFLDARVARSASKSCLRKNRTISREILSLSYEFSRLPTAWASPPGNALWVGPLCFLSPLFTLQSVQAAAAAVRGSLPPPVGGKPCNGSSPHHTTNHDRRCKLRTATLNPRRFSVASNGMLIVSARLLLVRAQ
ncbi:hypothetical protein M885DRAFT_627237 [Pelagophyceae sp. CCMP2097]|nr:hypothetical protein M885DRAFT_627237 [Pelagophyceae sp. CCMP2097]